MEKEGKKGKGRIALIIMLPAAIAALSVACVLLIIGIGKKSAPKETEAPKPDVTTFADYSQREVFLDVPALTTDHSRVADMGDCGDGTYGMVVRGTALSDYQAYLEVLTGNGFTQYADNGKDGLAGAIYTSSLTRDDLTLTVTQIINDGVTYIFATPELPLSEHLHYDESYVAGNEPGRKTKMHLVELWNTGDSFVFELKNGHFIVEDGGVAMEDLEQLLDYLESLVPAGQIPVIDAWIFTHQHNDHIGAFASLMDKPEHISRIKVNGIYWNPPSYEVFGLYDAYAYNYLATAKIIAKLLRTEDGTAPQIYRMEGGQRYYFNDITIDVLQSHEQVAERNYYNNLNTSSLCFMYTIDGEKILLCGDAERGNAEVLMRTFPSDYFDLKVFVPFHHGINLWYDFTDYLKSYEITVWPNYRAGSKDGSERYTMFSRYITDRAKESFGWGKGTVVLEFPYELGTAQFKPAVDWTKYTSQPRKGDHEGIWYWVDDEDFDYYIKNY